MKRQILLRRADLARHLGISKETVLNWTKQGLLIPVAKTIGGNRYDLDECEKRFNKIQKLKQQRKTLGEIKNILDKDSK